MIFIGFMFEITVADDFYLEANDWLKIIDEQTEQVITDNSPSTNKANYLLSKIKVRLNLTDVQIEQFEPIFHDHIEKRLGIMKKHGINQDFRSSEKKISLRQLRAIKKDMNKINKQVENQLAGLLSEEQIEEFIKIQEEQRFEMRGRLKNRDPQKDKVAIIKLKC